MKITNSIEIMIVISIIAVVMAIAVPGCKDGGPLEYVAYEDVIPPNKSDQAAQWIIDTVGAANPMSDEEPEDSIAQAQKTAIELFGQPTIGLRTQRNGVWVFVPYDKCNERQKKLCDDYLNGD